MPATPPKLVASDMDGTLLAPDRWISQRTVAAVRSVAAHGSTVVVATGRNHWSVATILERAGLDDGEALPYAICSNGATLYDVAAGTVIDRAVLNADHVGQIVEDVRRSFPDIAFAWETPNERLDGSNWLAVRNASVPGEVNPKWDVRDVDHREEEIVKLLVAHPEHVEIELLDRIAPLLPEGVNVSTSGASFVEVTAMEADKGPALERLCARLGVEREHTVAFGDHSNDLNMLSWVGRGYVMANGHDRALAVSPHRAPHHAEDGVAQILAELFGFDLL